MNSYRSLKRCPIDGKGRNRWLWYAARTLQAQGLSLHAAVPFLLREMVRTGPENYDQVVRTAERAYSTSLTAPKPVPHRSVKIAPLEFPQNHAELKKFYLDGDNCVRPSTPLEFIRIVLRDSPRICVGDDPARMANYDSRSLHEGMLTNTTLMVPNPMSAALGLNKSGAKSNRCESLVYERRYQIVEYDGMDLHGQILRLQHLRQFARLIAAVFSGGESVHAWFWVRQFSPVQQAAFFDYAVSKTGADPSHQSPVQMTRLPLAIRRETGNLQEILFFQNPPLL